QRPDQAIRPWPPVVLLDVAARAIDQVGVVDLDRAGRHAGEARETTIEMIDRLRLGRAATLQHGAYQIDAPARRIVLVAGQYIGGAGIGAEAVVHAGLENPVRLGEVRVRQLRLGKIRAHRDALVAIILPN